MSPRIAIVCVVAALAAIAGVAGGGLDGVAYADGGADARDKAAVSASDETTTPDYTRRILRALADDNANKWVRYWRARADCEAAAMEGEGAAPMERVLLGLTGMLCAQLDARLGVNPDAHMPSGEERPAGLVASEPGAAAGYTLFIIFTDTKKVYLIDPLGRVAHTWRLKNNPPGTTIMHAKLLENGNLMAMTRHPRAHPRAIVEIDRRDNIVWRYQPGHHLHHDFLKMPNGNAMLIVEGLKTREQAIAAGANPEFVPKKGIKYDYLSEVRPIGASRGEVVWEWSAWDHLVQDFDPTKPNYGAIAKHPELIDINFLLESISENRRLLGNDLMHANAIDYNPALDQIMLSPRHFSELWIIDHSADTEEARGHSGGNGGMGGDLLYRWGNPRAYKQGDHADQRLFWQHQTHWIPPGLPGAGNILVFNNGNEFPGYERFYSSVDEFVPPADGYRYRRAEGSAYPPYGLEWTYAAAPPSDFYAPVRSGAQRLPNGNALIADGPAGTIFQVTPNGRTVWKYIVPLHYHISLWQYTADPALLTFGTPKPDDNPTSVIDNSVYRAYWYPPDHPGLQALDLTPGAYIEDTPDLLNWTHAAILTGDFGEPLANSDFDIYLNEDDLMLIYFKRQCAAEDTQERFYLHLFPADARDLPAHRQEYGFDNKDFEFDDRGKARSEWCIAIAPLPDYAIERIRTGQFVRGEGHVWRADINLNE